MLTGEYRERFEELHLDGMVAKDGGDHVSAMALFDRAADLAYEHDDPLKRMHALTPGARARWTLGGYDEATERLEIAADIAAELDLPDEEGITISNIGRIAAVKTVHTVPAADQATALRATAVPEFREAYRMLKGHPHLYYRYANAQHGSVVTALAGERRLAARLVAEGLGVAFRKSAEPYDQVRTYAINQNRGGLAQLVAATVLIPFGNKTPLVAGLARRKLIR